MEGLFSNPLAFLVAKEYQRIYGGVLMVQKHLDLQNVAILMQSEFIDSFLWDELEVLFDLIQIKHRNRKGMRFSFCI